MADSLAAQPRLFGAEEEAALAARAQAGPYLSRAIWRGLWEAGRAHGRDGGAPLPRNRYGAAPPTLAARAVLNAYYVSTTDIEAPLNQHDADLFEAGRRFGAQECHAR